MPLNEIEKQFIEWWKKADFSSFNEADIREDFVAPLLKILGYSKNTVNDVLREINLPLSESYYRIGRKQIQIDYIPVLRKRFFWIIEAKSGKEKTMSFGDYLQAHFYAIHPEVQARYIVMTNGWEIRVYDSLQAASWEDTLIVCSQCDCETSFEILRNFLGSRNILNSIREHTLSILDKSLEAEIDENRAQALRSQINKMVINAIPKIKNNVRELERLSFKEAQEKENKELEQATMEQILIWMDNPIDPTTIVGEKCVQNILNADPKQRSQMLDLIAQRYRGRPHAIFRVQSVHVMIRLLEEGISNPASLYVTSVKDCLEELVKCNKSYWKFNPISNALCHLDNICLRLSKKICTRIAMDKISKLIEAQKATLSPEDLIKARPSIAREIIQLVGIFAEILWRNLSYQNTEKEIWEGIWQYQFYEKLIDATPEKNYPKGDSDLLFFENFGINIDLLLLGTWGILKRHSHKEFFKSLSLEIIHLTQQVREQIISSIPKTLEPPPDWKPKMDFLKELLMRFTAMSKALGIL